MTNKSFSFNEAITIQGLSTQPVGMLGGVFIVSRTLILPPTSSSNEHYFSLYLVPDLPAPELQPQRSVTPARAAQTHG